MRHGRSFWTAETETFLTGERGSASAWQLFPRSEPGLHGERGDSRTFGDLAIRPSDRPLSPGLGR